MDTVPNVDESTSSEVKDLLSRKVELEKWHKKQELQRQRVQVSSSDETYI